MNYLRNILITLFVGGLISSANAQYTIRDPRAIPLHGEWSFCMDPMVVGETNKWYREDFPTGNLDKVTVPHCFSTDPRYQFYTGAVWYRRTFPWKPTSGKRVLLHFDASYYETSIWLNGQKVGTHEGGYTPFHFDITPYLKADNNTLAVSVNNNTWRIGTIPGAKDNGQPNDPFPGWINYGGLIRPVYLTVEPEVYVENLKTEAVPDLAKNTATLKIKTRVRNSTAQAVTPKLAFRVMQNGKAIPLTWKQTAGSIGANQTAILEAETALKSADVKLWSIDQPNLYEVQVIAATDTVQTHIGIRKVEVRNAQLLLNGQPIKVAGGNRVVDYPGLGSLEPDWLVEKDMRLMKETGMELHRLTHYTPSETVYDWADRNGMLIIAEAGNWQLTPREMDNDTVRTKFRQQFREMVERDWNHPSVIAYSVGNEYLSEQPAGKRWTKDMIAYARELDPTRLYTFASMRLNILPKKPEDEASQYCDFVSTNTYGNHLTVLKHIHSLYPDKPIFISEYGTRADGKDGEAGQVMHIEKFLSDIRQLPYVVGASWWSFNDYLSRHNGTNPDGTRPWGLVRGDRSKRPLYKAHQTGMAPAILEKISWEPGPEGVHALKLRVTARHDFPSYVLKNYVIKTPVLTIPIPDLQPGQQVDLTIPVRGFDKTLTVDIVKPTGFSILTQTFDLKNDTRTGN
ncbi:MULTISPECIES: glycoside hydrolase family 2 TIM barrel-domain containing protein [unclassified Spirosoma]|uniref:glycoside hydrolase family 2 protein n=1 Tax=unclassified Spirosoma TaxID=2621999 RepID=UPI00095B14FF|nr:MULTISPECIES: glycoside hydrolase family 2 TIM barrel-domain containing protein [unclassified Spirosoma]MBN8822033.1 beta galactosidase jelly roll domain-containing protein [Spirosoma sp.]OJW80442.1 MAG: beta-galactosidase [Spirosoma sp. 48-14]